MDCVLSCQSFSSCWRCASCGCSASPASPVAWSPHALANFPGLKLCIWDRSARLHIGKTNALVVPAPLGAHPLEQPVGEHRDVPAAATTRARHLVVAAALQQSLLTRVDVLSVHIGMPRLVRTNMRDSVVQRIIDAIVQRYTLHQAHFYK
jgi:hypothetical protein